MISRSLLKYVTMVAVLAFAVGAGAGTFMETLLRIAGLTAAPTLLREQDQIDSGNIWIANLQRGTVSPLTTDGGYRSPIFSPADGSVYALKDDTVVRAPVEGGAPAPVQQVPGALKLIGFDGQDGDALVVLLSTVNSPLGVVSLKSGRVTPLPYDAKSEVQRGMLAQVRGQRRVYGDTAVYIKTERKRGSSPPIEWTDVYLKRGDAEPQNISMCDGVSCVASALSPDRQKVAFIKTAR
jgi:hypothetical protein